MNLLRGELAELKRQLEAKEPLAAHRAEIPGKVTLTKSKPRRIKDSLDDESVNAFEIRGSDHPPPGTAGASPMASGRRGEPAADPPSTSVRRVTAGLPGTWNRDVASPINPEEDPQNKDDALVNRVLNQVALIINRAFNILQDKLLPDKQLRPLLRGKPSRSSAEAEVFKVGILLKRPRRPTLARNPGREKERLPLFPPRD